MPSMSATCRPFHPVVIEYRVCNIHHLTRVAPTKREPDTLMTRCTMVELTRNSTVATKVLLIEVLCAYEM